MNCPKCNAELEENSIKCPACGTRVGRLCPACRAYNLITSKVCTSCGEVLLKICSKCNSINLPSSKLCRKCGAELEDIKKQPEQTKEKPPEQPEKPAYSANYHTLASAQETILSSIKAQNIKVISVNGDNEFGKAFIFKNLMRETANAGVAWLMGKCTPHTQLTPLGFFQSVLLNLFNVTNFCSNKKQLKRESVKFFKQDFDNLSTTEIYDLLNILYPENIDLFQNIQNNKQKTIRIIVKIFETILGKMNTVLVCENIEYIDSFSYEVLNILMMNDFIREKITFLLTFPKEQSGINCITAPCLNDTNFVDVTIMPFTKEQIEPIFNAYQHLNMSDDLKSKIMHFGQENPILVEQLINMASDAMRAGKEIKLSSDLKEVLQYRLMLLNETDNATYLILCAVSILGYKFYPIILNTIFNMNPEQIEASIMKLVKLNFIVPAVNSGFEFKTLNIWNQIIDLVKADSVSFLPVNQALYPLVSEYVLSTSAVLGFISQNLNFEEQTFALWTKCTQMAAYIGDTGLYIILQKQILSIIDKINLVQADLVKRTIYAELGKLMEPENPQLAMEYLSKAVMMLSEADFVEKIELLGYLASCSMKLKNYHGVIECVNNVIPLIPDNFPVEIAMMKSREIKALEYLGNTGAIVNMIDNDILPLLEGVLNNKVVCKTISQDDIFETWMNTLLNLAHALVIQGDNRSFKVLNVLLNAYTTNQVDSNQFLIKIQTTLAFANTMSGDIRTSIKILDDILSKEEEIEPLTMSNINLISVLNRYFMNKEDLTYDELFQAAQYADNIGDEFTKNILKLFLGRLMQDRTSAKEAANIFIKQIEYFADKQNAIGVLLGWYFISKAKMVVDGPAEALDIAVKALDIAESANITNHYFTLLLDKLIGEIYLALQDYESAKMYIEKALLVAKNFNIKYQLAELYILYSKYLQEYALTVVDKKVDYVLSAQQMNKKAALIADELKLMSLSSEIERADTVLNSFCQMNGIVLK